ncbi:rRNA maturation RNase YbeY [Candidatus Beckwithbacteria bacterium CG23_combo_of_CG06-09_8_20_14_all_34_8]|uniref:Endoribonuclease YbeY n=1 Tax=Candidatus Beckwithbacteria bacterium CG23_combo_of_CG06-09_8_20_14_all_34_8 TaxID=1974497 RepID=A0A2H0B6Q8_9BACT|nr:MAG: rRNA maturation RNase YbeY [Candidatus Beckwithbacteria bacterium CG23_combo_of_CG06-09_8_20_14_all_34_8]
MLNILIVSSSRYPIKRKQIKETIQKVLNTLKVTGFIEVEISIVGDRKMTQLHQKYMHEEGTTDVLSFPLHDNYIFTKAKQKNESGFVDPDGILRLGSIVISYPVAQKQANEHNITTNEEVARLVEHGMLHLLGIHHE